MISQQVSTHVGTLDAPSPVRAGRLSFRLRISERRLLLVLGDLFLSCLSILIALWIWALIAHHRFAGDFVLRHSYWFPVLPTLWYVLASANDYYDLKVAAHVKGSLARLARITLQLLAVYLIIFFVSPREALPRLFIIYYALISLLLIGIWRAGRLFLVGWTGFRRRVLIIGGGPVAERIWHALEEEAAGDYEVVGCVVSNEDTLATAARAPVVGQATDLASLIERLGIVEIVVTYLNAVPADVFQGVMDAHARGVAVLPMPILYERVTGRVPIEHVGEHLWALVLPFEGETLSLSLQQLVKRGADIVLAVLGLCVLAALLPVVALAVRLDSPGPVFYRQRRLGHRGVAFDIVKFRSMVDRAEKRSGPRWSETGDERITRVGKVLRKTRLDETPQLLNILRGEMSFVGPRPERPEFISMLCDQIPFYRSRLAVKPGLTGWAQVNYPYGSTVEDALHKLQYDLYYARHQSLAFDGLILLKTVGTILHLRGQ
jgi:exopolysaccharide biosynthesis polyprenyl glycosylphosphotransferase